MPTEQKKPGFFRRMMGHNKEDLDDEMPDRDLAKEINEELGKQKNPQDEKANSLEGDSLLFGEADKKAEKDKLSSEKKNKEKKPQKDKKLGNSLEVYETDEDYDENDEGNDMNNEDEEDRKYIKIKFRKPGKFFVERLVYIFIIVVLSILLFRTTSYSFLNTANIMNNNFMNNPSQQINSPGNTNTENSQPQTQLPTQTPVADNKNPSDLGQNEPKQTPTPTPEKAKSNCSGKVEIEFTEVNMNKTNDKKINSIVVTIKNKGAEDLNKYVLNLMWYNADTPADVKNLPKLKDAKSNKAGKILYSLKIPACTGEKEFVFTSEDLSSSYVSTREIANTFVVVLEDTEGKEIASDTYKLTSK